jgi:1,4-alpha-glucan branching enzyme
MRCLGSSGVFEIFIPGIMHGEIYKYEIKTPQGEIYVKSDPYAFYSELRPGTASIVYDLDSYSWNDRAWISKRDSSNIFEKPISIYEVHLGSWARNPEENNRFLTYKELAEKLVDYVVDMGYTHIELLPVAEHPFDGSWGYQITGYYSVTARYGKPEEFMYLIDRCHQNGIGVLMDWVPAHFPKDGHGLARFDGTALYEHYDKRQGEHPDWGTHVFNYSRHEVRNFLISNAVFWFEKYHIDGLRVDAVASMLYLDYGKKHGEWVSNRWGGKENVDAIEFMRRLNTTVYKYFPGIMMVAEESTSWALVSKPPYLGGLGFSFKWNMGWMNDYLRYISMNPVYRKYHHNNITFSIMYAFSENFILVLSHDEVVHGKCSMINKMPGDYRQKFAGLRATYGYMYGHPGKKLLFMGGEFGQFIEWNCWQSLDWHLLDYEMHQKLQRYVKDLNKLYKEKKALYELDFSYEGFEWIDCHDTDHSIVSFIRKGKDWRESLIFICNFTPVIYGDYRIGVPFDAYYEEILNSDSEIYGGSNTGNFGGVQAEHVEMHGRPYSLRLIIPPLSLLVLSPDI